MKSPAIVLLLLGLASVSSASEFDHMQESLFGREVQTSTRLGVGLGWAKATHPYFNSFPLDEWTFRLRLFNDAGNFYPWLRGVAADFEVNWANSLLLGQTWSVSWMKLASLTLDLLFRIDPKDRVLLYPFVGLGAGVDGPSSTKGATTAIVNQDPSLFTRLRAGIEWFAIRDVFSLQPGFSLTLGAASSGLSTTPIASVGFALDLMVYFR